MIYTITLYYSDNDKLITEYNLYKIKTILASKNTISYIKVIDASESEINALNTELHLHLVTLKNFATSKKLPKVEIFSEYISTNFYDIELIDADICYKINPINIILTKNLALIQSTENFSSFDQMILRIASDTKTSFLESCTLYYIILDVLVDNIFPIITCFENMLSDLQENLLKNRAKDNTKKLLSIRSNILKLRKYFTYEQEVLYNLSHEKLTLICEDEVEYMKDVYYHIQKLDTTLQEYNDWASSLSDAYSTYNSSKTNDKLQLLTIIQYIFMPLSFLTGWYGMGFKMPEVGFKYSYPIFVLIVVSLTISMLIYFKSGGRGS